MAASYRIILTKRAAADLEIVFNHIAADSPTHASQFVARILEAIEKLKDFPHRTVVEGQPVEAKLPVRSLAIQSYMIFFRVVENDRIVRILRVRHGAMRRPKKYE